MLAGGRGADRETGQVIVTFAVEARHLRGFPANQGGAGAPTALGDAGDHLAAGLDRKFRGGVIIQKKQRLTALHHQVVDAHGDQVDTDRVMAAGLNGDHQFGADAIGRGQ